MALSCVKTTDNIDTSVDMSIMPNSIIHLNIPKEIGSLKNNLVVFWETYLAQFQSLHGTELIKDALTYNKLGQVFFHILLTIFYSFL